MEKITVEITINSPIEKVRECWTNPEHIVKRCHASDDRHAPKATNDLTIWWTFSTTMAAKDWSFSFDFGWIYDDVKQNEKISYAMDDWRKVEILFKNLWESVTITETFDSEDQNPIEMQKAWRQAILENFKKHTESN